MTSLASPDQHTTIRAPEQSRTMRAAAMQPYFFPYLGYFQLLAACDVFLIRDDVQFIKGGWINRNRILGAEGPEWMTMPVARATHTLAINQRHYVRAHPVARRIPGRLETAYRAAPYFERTMDLVGKAFACADTNVATLNTYAIRLVAEALGIPARIELASNLRGPESCTGSELVIELCHRLNATTYVNPIGGRELYDPDAFARRKLALRFLTPTLSPYRQFGAPHIASLSILDVMMFNDVDEIRRMVYSATCLPSEGPYTGAHHE